LAEKWRASNAAVEPNGVTQKGCINTFAVHVFNNDATAAKYIKEAATLVWRRTIDWLNKYLRR
jgi:dienelactone hydrolase